MGKTWRKAKIDVEENQHLKKAGKHGHYNKFHGLENPDLMNSKRLRPIDLYNGEEGLDPLEGDDFDLL